jgi:exosortase/archaeosortase family protein
MIRRRTFRPTFKLAIIGVAVLTLLNAVRILILIWVGYSDGAAEFWSLHNWVGYALFLGFYLVAIPLYVRTNTVGTLDNWKNILNTTQMKKPK